MAPALVLGYTHKSMARRWTNREDRVAADVGIAYTAEEAAEKINRTPAAILSRRQLLKGKPCPFWVWGEKKGERWFCEQGDFGHEPTCYGGKSLETYIVQGGTWP